MRRSLFLGVLAFFGCNAELGQPGSGADANLGGSGADAPSEHDAPITPDAPACFNGRVVYLNFTGVTLTDATTSDATLNQASWMTIASGTVPAFRNGLGTRLTDIQTITTGITSQLSQFPVTVVTTRPASGPYVMIAFGGTSQQVGTIYSLAVNELDCGDVRKSDVAWISDAPGITLQQITNTAVGAIGFGLGLTATSDPNDCMCGWANVCQPNVATACTLSPSITRDPQSQALCAGVTTQNEQQAFSQAFCQ